MGRTVDADGHYMERAYEVLDYIEPKYREAYKRREDDKRQGSGSDNPSGAHPQYRRRGVTATRLVGVDMGEGMDMTKKGMKDRESHPDAHDAHARLRAMDEEGIDGAILYTTALLSMIPEPALQHAVNRATNDWLADWTKADPKRLFGSANIVAIHDVDAACAEVRRAVNKHGFRAIFLRSCTARKEDTWWGKQYDPFWATCQDLDVAVGLHPGPGDLMYGCARYFDIIGPTPEKLFMRTAFNMMVDSMHSTMGLIVGGILQRFPRLRIGVLESSGGWLITLLERLDYRYETLGHTVPELKLKPSDYFRRQGWVSFDPQETPLKLTAEWLGADRIIWGSDYPHPDAFYPGFVHMLNQNIAGLNTGAQDRIRGLNALDFYHLRIGQLSTCTPATPA